MAARDNPICSAGEKTVHDDAAATLGVRIGESVGEQLCNDLIDTLNIWAQFIYAPLLEDKTRLIEETNTGIYGRETANKVHIELRKLGGVEVPREFVFMDRAAIGLGSVFLRLGAEINWHRMFHDLIRDFDVKTLAKRQAKALKDSRLGF